MPVQNWNLTLLQLAIHFYAVLDIIWATDVPAPSVGSALQEQVRQEPIGRQKVKRVSIFNAVTQNFEHLRPNR